MEYITTSAVADTGGAQKEKKKGGKWVGTKRKKKSGARLAHHNHPIANRGDLGLKLRIFSLEVYARLVATLNGTCDFPTGIFSIHGSLTGGSQVCFF